MNTFPFPKQRILIVDDHPVMSKGLELLIRRDPMLEVCGHAKKGSEVLNLIQTTRPQVMILDISLPDMNGLDLLKTVRELHPSLSILVYSMHEEQVHGERAIRMGAQGYLMKSENSDTVMQALHEILRGHTYVSPRLNKLILQRYASSEKNDLSDREFVVLDLIGKGHKTGEIAEKLRLSVNTIETYRSRLKQKLGLTTAPELTQYAQEWFREDRSGRSKEDN